METIQIIEQLDPIFKDVLDNENIKLTETTSAADIEEWDSLTNVQLIVAIEKHFKVRFTTAEIQKLNNVGDLCALVKAKSGN
jgi:acyl carrier protein